MAGRKSRALLLFAFLLAALLAAPAFASDEPPPPKLKISGYGLLGNLQLKHNIKLLEFEEKPPRFFDADFIENAGMIIEARLRNDGYLNPAITVKIALEDGGKLEQPLNAAAPAPLPRKLRARLVRFQIKPGVLYHYGRIQFTELSALGPDEAEAFFVETSGLLRLKRNRIYTPERLNRSVADLQATLNRLGYRDAKVSVARLDRDDRTGAVEAEIQVRQGHKFMVRSVREEVFINGAALPAKARTNALQAVYSRLWSQDYLLGLKTNYYRLGYPETTAEFQIVQTETTDEVAYLDLLAEIRTGPLVRAGRIDFTGAKHTRPSVIKKHMTLKTGDPLNRMKAEQDRYRLSRLGAFDQVTLNYEPVSTNLWDVNYALKEGKRMDLNLIFGFGTYDIVRGGVEVNNYNLWGLAHHSRLQLIQSFKSSSANYTYTIPEPFGQDLDFFLNGFGLRREEVSFVRLEYGGGAGVQKQFPRSRTDATLRYNYGLLGATETSANFAPIGATNPIVGEILLDVAMDRRNSPLDPQRGYRLSANLEAASPYLGGEVGFELLELAAAWHLPVHSGEWLHLGARHGVAATIGRPSDDLPFARRFFPGGENSVRGYQEGEAAPRDANGNIVGAETYLSGTAEFEQAVTPKWSLVAFVDAVLFAQNLSDYPGNEALYSVGGGLRWKTLIGPLRLEYGYNLNPRPKDPVGTVQFSLGCPF